MLIINAPQCYVDPTLECHLGADAACAICYVTARAAHAARVGFAVPSLPVGRRSTALMISQRVLSTVRGVSEVVSIAG